MTVYCLRLDKSHSGLRGGIRGGAGSEKRKPETTHLSRLSAPLSPTMWWWQGIRPAVQGIFIRCVCISGAAIWGQRELGRGGEACGPLVPRECHELGPLQVGPP